MRRITLKMIIFSLSVGLSGTLMSAMNGAGKRNVSNRVERAVEDWGTLVECAATIKLLEWSPNAGGIYRHLHLLDERKGLQVRTKEFFSVYSIDEISEASEIFEENQIKRRRNAQ